MDEAEKRLIFISPIAGVGVVVTKDYGHAHKMYVKSGYIPDGITGL